MASIFLSATEGVWFVKYRTADGWKRAKLGTHPVPFPPSRPPKKCPDALAKKAEEYIERERLWREGREPGRKTPLIGYLSQFAESFAITHSPDTSRNFARISKNFGEFCVSRGVETLQAIDRQTIRKFLEDRFQKVSPNTVRSERTTIHAILNRAVADGLILSNPCKGVKAPGKPDPSPPTFWSAEQVQAIADACLSQWHRDMVLVMANTGLRISAALAMRWDWVNESEGLILVPKIADKGGKGYAIPMTATVRAILKRRKAETRAKQEDSPLVFPGEKGEPYSPTSFATALKRAIKKVGAPEGNPHDLRHTFARLLCLEGTPITVVQAILGHSSITMTQRYSSFGTDQTAAWLKSFSVGTSQNGQARQDGRPVRPGDQSPDGQSDDR